MAPTLLDPLYEILAREVVYILDRPEFSDQVNAFLAETGYTIDRSFNDPTTGFQAFGLIASDKPPVLVFQPTNIFPGVDQQLDEIANADVNGVGYSQFQANKVAIGEWLDKFSSASVKPDIIGASSGGSLAQLAATEFIDKVGNIVTFNSAGTSNATATEFLNKGGVSKNVTHYVVEGDVVSLAGEAFLAGTVVLQSYPNLITIDSKTYAKIDPAFTLFKHRENRRLLTPSLAPPGYTQTIIPVATLNDPEFNFNSEPSYAQFLNAYNAISPDIAASLTSRQAEEALRTSPNFINLGGFIGLIVGAQQQLAPNQSNVLVGDAQNNYADGAEQNDIIFGKFGDDLLRGGSGQDEINGGIGRDRLLGDEGKDILIGGTGDDELIGGKDNDLLIGVDPGVNISANSSVNISVRRPGLGEIDTLRGNQDRDTFVLGNGDRAFYDDGIRNTVGKQDYALIADFKRKDFIQLHGTEDNYVLKRSSGNVPTGIGIFLDTSGRDELIGIVQGVSNFRLITNSFIFVS